MAFDPSPSGGSCVSRREATLEDKRSASCPPLPSVAKLHRVDNSLETQRSRQSTAPLGATRSNSGQKCAGTTVTSARLQPSALNDLSSRPVSQASTSERLSHGRPPRLKNNGPASARSSLTRTSGYPPFPPCRRGSDCDKLSARGRPTLPHSRAVRNRAHTIDSAAALERDQIRPEARKEHGNVLCNEAISQPHSIVASTLLGATIAWPDQCNYSTTANTTQLSAQNGKEAVHPTVPPSSQARSDYQYCIKGQPSDTDRIRCIWSEDFSWGRDFSKFVGQGYMPIGLAEKLEDKPLIEQLFIIRQEMKLRIRYEMGRETIRRPSKNRGMNRPVTYASNIWNRGYANCAGHCVVLAAVLQRLGVPYCIVAIRSLKRSEPKHAILEIGFPEATDTRKVNQRARELWAQFHGSTSTVRRDPETNEATRVKLFAGLKFSHSPAGSEAASRKGVGHWLWLDPQARVGCYLHLIDKGYLIQTERGFTFALPPEIKSWREVASEKEHCFCNSDTDEPDETASVSAQPPFPPSTSPRESKSMYCTIPPIF